MKAELLWFEKNTFANRQAFWQIICCSSNGVFVIRKQQLSKNGGRVMSTKLDAVTEQEYNVYVFENNKHCTRKETADLNEDFFSDILDLINPTQPAAKR